MNIGIDIDDTITLTYEETFPRAMDFVKNVLKRDVKPNLNHAFDHHYIENVLSLSKEEMDLFWEENLADLLKKVKPKKNAIEVINRLKEEGHNIVIITARWKCDYCESEKISREWFEKYNMKYDKLFIDLESKKQTAIDEKIDLFIDDSIKNYKEVSEAGIKCLLFKSEVNCKNEESKNFDIVDSWDEVYRRIKDGRI